MVNINAKIYFIGESSDELNEGCVNNIGMKKSTIFNRASFFTKKNNLVRLFETAPDIMICDIYKIAFVLIKHAGEHARRFDAPTIDEMSIVMMEDQLQSGDFVHCRIKDHLKSRKNYSSYGVRQSSHFLDGAYGHHFNIKMINAINGEGTNKK